jgi:hypothetical protein
MGSFPPSGSGDFIMMLSIWNRRRGLLVFNASISKVRLHLSTQLPSHCGALHQTTQFRRGQHHNLFRRRCEHLGMELWVQICCIAPFRLSHPNLVLGRNMVSSSSRPTIALVTLFLRLPPSQEHTLSAHLHPLIWVHVESDEFK